MMTDSTHLAETDFCISAFCIAVDTREQHPWQFRGLRADFKGKYRPLVARTESKALLTGDYSIVGAESRVALERKSLEDLYSTLGQRRGNFVNELERMASFEYAAIVIEATEWQVCNEPPKHSKLQPKSVWRSLLAFEQRYGVHVHYAHSRSFAERKAYRILERFYRDKLAGSDSEDHRQP